MAVDTREQNKGILGILNYEHPTCAISASLNGYVFTQGGVGKTTLTFHLSSQYARTHATERILVVDMCPQANISSALLGKGQLDN